MNSSVTFPEKLLHESKERKLAYFKEQVLAHPNIESAKENLKRIVKNPGETFVVFVYGPTGAGKTTLRRLIEKEIVEEYLSTLERDRGCIPVACIEVALQQSGLFNSKDHLKRCLVALNEPEKLIECKLDYGTRGIFKNEEGQIVIERSVLETELGWALEKALIYRHPKIFMIDEAHHMLKVASGRKLLELPEAIKSLANRTKVVHGLLGTYDLLMLQDIGDQLSRRSAYIHFPRYDANKEKDKHTFQSLILSFLIQMPLSEPPELLKYWEYIYAHSLGCVGTLKNWFNNALADALEEGANTLTIKHLEARSLSIAQCQNILKNIKSGESKHAQVEGNFYGLLKELGLEIELQESHIPVSTATESSETEKPISKQSRTTDVGMPSPNRHPVGREEDAKY